MIKLLLLIICCALYGSIYPQNFLSDKKATKETVNLYQHLRKVIAKEILFGHQDNPDYGIDWKYKKNRNDVKDATPDYSAVYGWELGR